MRKLVTVIIALCFCGLAFGAPQDQQTSGVGAQVDEAIRLAGGGEVGVAEFYITSHKWPESLGMVYTPAKTANDAGKWVDRVYGGTNGKAYGIVARFKIDGVDPRLAGRAIEMWTLDGGQTWHCGVAGSPNKAADARLLPRSCHESAGRPSVSP